MQTDGVLHYKLYFSTPSSLSMLTTLLSCDDNNADDDDDSDGDDDVGGSLWGVKSGPSVGTRLALGRGPVRDRMVGDIITIWQQ